MKVYKSLRTWSDRCNTASACGLKTQMRIFGQLKIKKSKDWHRENIGGSAPLWSLCMLPGWAKQSQWNSWRHNCQAPNVTFPSTCLPGVHQSVHQWSKTNIYSTLCASGSDASHCAQRPPTTSVMHATTACHRLDHRLIIGYGNSKIGYEIIRVSHP